jgi:mannose-1-phosphate guanylyltransferase
MKIHNVILTGGVGSRLWPLSRKNNPKQYLPLFKGKSLFELTIDRNLKIASEVIVVGNIENKSLTEDLLRKSDLNCTIITESVPRNTAAAIAFAAFSVHPDDILIVTPSDHIIENEVAYEKAMQEAVNLAIQNAIVTFGVVPTKPETGYGYIEYNDSDVISFREKPNLETAQMFLNKGNFLWNSGMFCFKAGVVLDELLLYNPEIYHSSKKVWEHNCNGDLNAELSLLIPSISVDYAIMEVSKKIKVIPSSFEWSDLGSFEAIYDYLVSNGHTTDLNGNMVIGTEKFTAFLGVKNTIFVATDTANLILQKENAQEVKNLYNRLENENPELL